MSDDIEAELDQLFQLLPGALVEARALLADRLKKAGDRAGALRIKAIRRPTPAAWALNQLFFRQPALLERALEQAEQVRELHARDGVEQRQLALAVEAQRVATQAVVEAAMKLSEAAGQLVDAAQQRKLLTTLQGWLSGAGDEPPGRMTRDVAPSGFDAVRSVGSPPPRPLPVVATTTRRAAQPRPLAVQPQIVKAPEPPGRRVDALKLARAAELLAQRQQKAQRAAELVRERALAAAGKQAELSEAEASVRAAEIALEELRLQRSRSAAQLALAQAALVEAEASARAADEAAARAREEHAAVAGEQG